MTVAAEAPIDVDYFDELVRAAMTEADPLESDPENEDAVMLAKATMRRATVGSQPMGHQPNNQYGFFRVASNGVASGRIPGRESSTGVPGWLEGTSWRPSLCAEVESEEIDCSNCGNGFPLVNYMFPNKFGNQTAKAFEFALRDLNDLSTCPLNADSLRMKLGQVFGRHLWAQVQAANLPDPTGAVNAFDAAWCVDQLEYEAGFVGNGTLLVPALLTRHLTKEGAITWVNGERRTTNGNRVLTEGITAIQPGAQTGVMKIALVGPIDFARTLVTTDTEKMRDLGNQQATAHRGFGMVRTDLCAGLEINAIVPPSESVVV